MTKHLDDYSPAELANVVRGVTVAGEVLSVELALRELQWRATARKRQANRAREIGELLVDLFRKVDQLVKEHQVP